MSEKPSISTLLSTLTGSLISSLSALPTPSAVRPPPSSFSLLSTKNELFLSYLQNLTFLVILNLRTHSARIGISKENEKELDQRTNGDAAEQESLSGLRDAVVENLIGLRVYLEKGVRPLEGRLKYQLDKLLLAAADQARESAKQHSKSRNQITDSGTGVVSVNDHEDESNNVISSIPPLAHRPNPAALMRPSSTNYHPHPTSNTSTTKTTAAAAAAAAPYRPPRINPTAPPTESTSKRAPRRSRAVDAFIREEMGDAPVTEMSIGAGRGGAAEGGKEAERERERKEWEEARLVRLPGEKKRRRGMGEDIMAGMDWGLMNDDRGNGEDSERKRKKKKGAGGSMKAAKGRGSGKHMRRK